MDVQEFEEKWFFISVFGAFVKEGNRCYHTHGEVKHETRMANCKNNLKHHEEEHHEDICEKIPHRGVDGCPTEVLDEDKCDGPYCQIGQKRGGLQWNGNEAGCGCLMRIIEEADLEL